VKDEAEITALRRAGATVDRVVAAIQAGEVPTTAAATAWAWASCSTAYRSRNSAGGGPRCTQRVMSEQ